MQQFDPLVPEMTESPISIQRPWLTAAAANKAVEAAMQAAIDMNVNIVIHVSDPAGNPIAMLRMDKAPLFSVEVAAKKAWTAAASGIPTPILRDVFNADPTLLHALAPKVANLMAVGGATPVIIDDQVAGSIGVSGASEDQDQTIAEAALAALLP